MGSRGELRRQATERSRGKGGGDSVRNWLVAHRVELLAFLGLAAAVVLVYQPAWNGGFLWDDNYHITRPELRSLEGLWKIWSDPAATAQYYPLTHSLFWVTHWFWGDATLGYHLLSIALHLCSAALIVAILRKLEIPGAYLAAAIFALHPVNVESVAWIAEIKNTLSTVFYLGAFRVYLTFDQGRQRRFYLVALTLFALALLSKTVTVTLPAALLVVFWWQRGRLRWREDVAPLLPFFALALAAGYFTSWVERHVIGAEGSGFDFTLIERMVLASRIIWFYLVKLAWPENLTFIYARWNIHSPPLWQLVYPAGIVALVGLCWAVRHRSRAPLAALLYFIGTLAPMLGFFNVYYFIFSFVADHFQYIASLSVITLAASGAALGLTRLGWWGRWNGNALCGVALLALGVASWRQSAMYTDAETLYRATIARNPDAWLAHSNLGVVLAAEGRMIEAIDEDRTALRLDPPKRFQALFNLGTALLRTGHPQEAAADLQAALVERPGDPESHNDLGIALAMTGRQADAIRQFQEAIRLYPEYEEARRNLIAVSQRPPPR